MIEICDVKAFPDHILCLDFDNGEKRLFDMKPYLHYPIFRRLENQAFFSLARVDYGTVTWPGEIDIAPETVYKFSVPFVSATDA